MSKEQALKFLSDYKVNRALMEKVDDIFEDNPDKPDNELWVLAAKECGYQFTPEELEEVFHKKIQEQAETETKLSAEALDEAELSAVAGGAESENCHDSFWCENISRYSHDMSQTNCKGSFLNRENCWHDDGCDSCYNIYPNYECKRNGQCSYAFTHR